MVCDVDDCWFEELGTASQDTPGTFIVLHGGWQGFLPPHFFSFSSFVVGPYRTRSKRERGWSSLNAFNVSVQARQVLGLGQAKKNTGRHAVFFFKNSLTVAKCLHPHFLNNLNIEINVELVFHLLLGVFLERCDSLIILVCDSLPPNNHDCNDCFFQIWWWTWIWFSWFHLNNQIFTSWSLTWHLKMMVSKFGISFSQLADFQFEAGSTSGVYWYIIYDHIWSRWWQLKYLFNFHPYLGKIPILTSIFFKWVVQPPTSDEWMEVDWWLFPKSFLQRFLLGLGFLVFMMYRLGSEDRRYKEERIKQSAFGNNKGGWLGAGGSWVGGCFCCFCLAL